MRLHSALELQEVEDLTSFGLSIFKVSFAVVGLCSHDLADDSGCSSGPPRAQRSIARLRHAHDSSLNEQDRRKDFVFDRWSVGSSY